MTLSKPSTKPVTVDFASADGTANDGRDKLVSIAEKATGEVTFKSVFEPDASRNAIPRIPDGLTMTEPKFEKGHEYLVKPVGNQRPVPRFSRRQALARLATSGRSQAFNRNIVNRLWAMMMGRGLVHPVDLRHSGNPPSHPELLQMLADEFVRSDFDVKNLLRELALSRTYQRSTQPAGDGATEPDKQPDIQPEEPFDYSVGELKPLSAEQLAFSVLQASGATAVSRMAVKVRLKDDPKFLALLKADAKRRRLHAEIVERAVAEDLQDKVEQFVKVFAGSGNQGFQATAHQALFLSNGDAIRGLLKPVSGNLTARLLQIDDASRLADELYLSVLTRRPSADETAAVTGYLQRRRERESAIQELTWALLTSIEFRFNH